jgi:selenocysteine-specific elongation factor
VHVVATAGHVDHGKSTLVRALTGQDPDRLEEEKRRGLSIRLGYCWTSLDDVGDVAFVDVPGHERFLATTLSGVGPVPVVMLVVAADDPWMPQAAEHLAALDALDVRHGLLVVTRADLADPAPALARARDELSRTSLAGAGSVVCSGVTGEGLGDLRRALADLLLGVPPADPHADVRLWVDRMFHARGTGTVVTGTLQAGTVRAGDLLSLDDREVRVRGVECLGQEVGSASGVARVALALAGVPAGTRRDSVLVTPRAFDPVTTVDVRLRGAEDLPERPLFHVGATSLSVHARPLGDGFARLALERALPLRVGDHALLRDPGDRSLWGVEVLDVDPPALRRRGAAARRAEVLATLDGTLASELAARHLVHRQALRRRGVAEGDAPPGALVVGDWFVSPERADELRTRLTALVRASTGGVTGVAAAHALGLPESALVSALVSAPLEERAGRITLVDDLPGSLTVALHSLRQDLDETPFGAPDAARLADLGLDPAALARLAREGLVLRLGDNVVLLPGADDVAVRRLADLDQPFTTSEARQALATTRRVALPLLDHLDRTGRTVRLPDDRRRLR